MNKVQEEALIMMFIMPIGAIIDGGVILGIGFFGGLTFWAVCLQLALFGILGGFLWLLPILMSKYRKKKSKVTFDERDELIQKRAAIIGYGAVWFYFVSASMIIWWLSGPQGKVFAVFLPGVVFVGIAVFVFVQSAAVLIQYGWGGSE